MDIISLKRIFHENDALIFVLKDINHEQLTPNTINHNHILGTSKKSILVIMHIVTEIGQDILYFSVWFKKKFSHFSVHLERTVL